MSNYVVFYSFICSGNFIYLTYNGSFHREFNVFKIDTLPDS